jgi:hypothetical protein
MIGRTLIHVQKVGLASYDRAFKKPDWPTVRHTISSLLASKRCSVDSMEELFEIDLSSFRSLGCQERLNDKTYDQLIAEHEEFHTHSDLFRFFKRILMGYPAPAHPNECCPYLCEQNTEEPIHRIEEVM